MNFKLSLWKSIASVIGGIVLGFLANESVGSGPFCELGAPCPGPLIPLPYYIFILFFVILIYIIWSLVEKE